MTVDGGGPGARRWLRTDNILLAALIGLVVWITGDVLLLVFGGLLLAVGFDGLAKVLQTRVHLPRWLALPAGILLVVGFFALIGATVVPAFLGELDELRQRLVEAVEQMADTLFRNEWAGELLSGGGNEGRIFDAAGIMAQHAASAMLAFIGILGSLVILVAIALFGAADPTLYRQGLLALVSPGYRRRVDETLSASAHALRWWFLGQAISMLTLGVTVSVGLMLIGVDLWLSLGVLTGLLTLIPFLGPIIAGVPVIIIGFAAGTQTGLIVLAFYLVVQNLEGNVLVPLIQRRAANLAPALLIGMQVLMGALFGIVGLILAAPLAVVGMVAVQKLYVEDVLGDPPPSSSSRTTSAT